MSTYAIVVAAGSGVRMGSRLPKAFLPLAGRALVAWSLAVLDVAPGVDAIVVVAPPGREHDMILAIGAEDVQIDAVVPGGATRSRSVAAGLDAVPGGVERVLVHDAARPLVSAMLVAAVLDALDEADGAIAASPVADTLKRADDGLAIADTVERVGLWRAETPQAFRADVLRRAFDVAEERLDAATDCASLVEAIGGLVRLVPSGAPNLKVTTPADLDLAEHLLRAAGRVSTT